MKTFSLLLMIINILLFYFNFLKQLVHTYTCVTKCYSQLFCFCVSVTT